MVSNRNRILDAVNYIESCGVSVNIGKNKARGNKGFFKAAGDSFRIDIAKGQNEDDIMRILAHEFAHYVHYQYDRTLSDLGFIFNDDEDITEELIKVTVSTIPKKTVEPLFLLKENLTTEIKCLKSNLKAKNLDYKQLEASIKKTPYKYLLKYDKVRVKEIFREKVYSIDSMPDETDEYLYLKLLSKKRMLKRLTAKISRLNKYYNSQTELFARSFELYVMERKRLEELSPKLYNFYEDLMKTDKIPFLIKFVKNLI